MEMNATQPPLSPLFRGSYIRRPSYARGVKHDTDDPYTMLLRELKALKRDWLNPECMEGLTDEQKAITRECALQLQEALERCGV
jgi:hypothetical protein